ncbi:MAG: hypothetical protein KAW92_05745 [Candidatus Cloacimonetes bacterium]|nr:hypothetical protein [Candidatus Cloacimonadota bacterium]
MKKKLNLINFNKNELKKTGNIVLLFISFLLLFGCEKFIDEEQEAKTWKIQIHLDIPDLVLQWAVFDKDPVPGFKDRVVRWRVYQLKREQEAKDSTELKMLRWAGMNQNWYYGFSDVTGDQVKILKSASVAQHGNNAPDGKKWIVTKIVWINGEPVCWCLPIEVKKGKMIEITMNKDNVFPLAETYDKVMKQ